MGKRVSEVMKTDVVTISPEMPMADIQRLFVKERFGAVPVLDREERLLGIVSRSDVVRKFSLEQTFAELSSADFDAKLGVTDNDDLIGSIGAAAGRRLANVRAEDLMISDVITVAPDAPLSEAADSMLERRIHRLPVVQNERLVGIVSAFDFMRLYASEASNA
ncbi:MAG: CBS domain-containing protein [Myxococcota bacterium]